VVTGIAAYAGYAGTRWLDPGSGIAGARTTATVVVLLVGLWTLTILARPLVLWKVALIATMAALAAAAVAIPPLAQGILLLEVTPVCLLVGGVTGAVGALVVELVHRAAPLAREAPAVSLSPRGPRPVDR
jgi:cation-transporting ATPase E